MNGMISLEGRDLKLRTALMEHFISEDISNGRRVQKMGFGGKKDDFDLMKVVNNLSEDKVIYGEEDCFYFNDSSKFLDSRSSSSNENRVFAWLSDKLMKQGCKLVVAVSHYDTLDIRARRAVSLRILTRAKVDSDGMVRSATIRLINLNNGMRDTRSIKITPYKSLDHAADFWSLGESIATSEEELEL